MKSLNTWKLISRSLETGIPVMLLYVLESHGSSPGRRDFLMAVNAGGEMEGSLGGGIMEHKFIEMAKAKLLENASLVSLHKQIHNKTAASHQSGMICSGEQTILLYTVQKHDAPQVQSIIDCYMQYTEGILKLSPAGICFSTVSKPEKSTGYNMQSATEWSYLSEIGYKNHLYIIGGGHCALALSRIMYTMEFYIHLYDNRPGLKTMVENNSVHDMNVLEDYSLLAQLIPPGDHIYTVIMTFGYRTDAIALQALISKNFKYLGLLGSKSKINRMFADLKSQGIDEHAIKKIHAPIGIPINSRTPEEVAVSIAAEIVKIKNER